MHLYRWGKLPVLAALLVLAAACQGGGTMRSARTSGVKAEPVDPPGNGGKDPKDEVDPEGDETTDDGYEANDATYYQDVKALLVERCASCHVAQEQAPLLSTYMHHYLARDEIRTSIRDDRMPPGAPLSAEEKKLVLGWIKAGAPQGVHLEFTNFGNDVKIGPHDAVEIDVNVDASAQAKWSLYWTKNPDDTTSGSLATAPQSVINKTASWQVSGLPAGDYYVYAKVEADSREAVFKAPQKVRLGQPSIRLASAWRKGRIGFTNPATLSYSFGNTSGEGALAVRVEYKNGASSNSYTKLTDSAGATEYTLPALPEGDDYYFRVSLLEDGEVVASHETQDLIAFANQLYVIEELEGNCVVFNCHPDHGKLESNMDVLDRIKNVASPMPPNGVLSSAEQLKIRLWFWQNYEH